MKRSIGKVTVLLLLIALAAPLGRASGKPDDDPISMGKPLSYWLECIEKLDMPNLSTAFRAIERLGPDAWSAVPQLTNIVAAPFIPITLGFDDSRQIATKLFSIHFRADAIDALAAIGEASAPSARTLIQWALTPRVVPGPATGTAEDELFVDLVVIDVIQRMRVAGAVASFGPDAYPVVANLLASPDGESRKLAVAILGQNAPPVVSALFKSWSCQERELAINMIVDMWPVLPREHLNALESLRACDETN